MEFSLGQAYTFVGPNGCGKSTLLQVLSGAIPATEGSLFYPIGKKNIDADSFFQYLVVAAPYLELIEEFTLTELLDFHRKFKPLAFSTPEVIDKLGLGKSAHKEIRNFSSGMKQRVKLGLAFWSETPILILDEPTANLDGQGISWYQQQIETYRKNRLLLLASNQPHEYEFACEVMNVSKLR